MTRLSLGAALAFVLVGGGCGGGGSTIPSITTDTGVNTDTGSGGDDTGTPSDTGAPGDTSTGDDGDGAGSTSCAAYCDSMPTVCKGIAHYQYLNKTTCLKMCAIMDLGASGDMSGDTVGCRMYYAGLAASDPRAHCKHAGAYGGDTCGATRCDVFCKLALAQCPTSAAGPYDTVAACKTACPAFDTTKSEIESNAGGKLNCLQYHLEAAYTDPGTHCKLITVASGPCK